MKKSALFVSCLLGLSAQAQVLQSDLTKIKTSSPTGLIAAAENARATIDLKNRAIKLDFYKNGKFVTGFETPLQTVHESVCDTLIYQGTVDIDMGLVEIVISDNKHFGDHCVSYFPVPTTGATLKFTSTFTGELTYRMEGTELKSE